MLSCVRTLKVESYLSRRFSIWIRINDTRGGFYFLLLILVWFVWVIENTNINISSNSNPSCITDCCT